jgi:hypothetical protein
MNSTLEDLTHQVLKCQIKYDHSNSTYNILNAGKKLKHEKKARAKITNYKLSCIDPILANSQRKCDNESDPLKKDSLIKHHIYLKKRYDDDIETILRYTPKKVPDYLIIARIHLERATKRLEEFQETIPPTDPEFEQHPLPVEFQRG